MGLADGRGAYTTGGLVQGLANLRPGVHETLSKVGGQGVEF